MKKLPPTHVALADLPVDDAEDHESPDEVEDEEKEEEEVEEPVSPERHVHQPALVRQHCRRVQHPTIITTQM